jgi:hypothetical protein
MIRRLATEAACGAAFIAFLMLAFFMAGAAEQVI